MAALRLTSFRSFPPPEEAPDFPAIVFLPALFPLLSPLLPLPLLRLVPLEAAPPLLERLFLAPLGPFLAPPPLVGALLVTTRAPSASSKLLSFLPKAPCLELSAIRPAINLADL